MSDAQADVDRRNIAFWDELCGTALARDLGVTDSSPESLARFDEYYLGYLYPYLEGYLPAPGDGNVLEVGLGYGTVTRLLAERGLDYLGLDIAEGPVEMARHRLALLGIDDPEGRVQVGSILDAPYPDESIDNVIAIGCLHHTGDLPGAIGEVHRMLRPGGRVVAMVYNRFSFRRMKMSLSKLRSGMSDEDVRRSYDANTEGEAAPATEYVTAREAKRLFRAFSHVRVRRENFDDYMRKGELLPRERFLGLPARIAGLDLYVTAIK